MNRLPVPPSLTSITKFNLVITHPLENLLYLVIVNYYSSSLIQKLITSIPKNQGVFFEIIIVNNSPDDLFFQEWVNQTNLSPEGTQLTVLETGENLGFGKACNIALQWIYQQNPQGIVWLINPDAYFSESDSLLKAIHFFETYPEVSILGTLVKEPSGKIWFGRGEFNVKTGRIVMENTLPLFPSKTSYLSMSWVTGCSLLFYLQNFPECPYFDPDYFLYYEDCELCQRYSKQGHMIAFTPLISLIHQPSSITSKNSEQKIQQSIYSYLLTLEKHTKFPVLFYRLSRIFFVSLILLPLKFSSSRNKLIGVLSYLKNRLFFSSSSK